MIETDPFAGPRPDNPLKTDDESASMSFDMGLDGLEPAEANITEVPKTYENPNDDHVGYLRSNPDLVDDFDMKFGPGAGARHLGQDPKPPPLPETPTIDTGYILESMRDDPDPFPQLDEVLDDQAALNIQRRDTAILKSMVRARQEPDRLEAGWVDQEISSALKNYQRLVGKAGVMGPFTPGIDSAIKVADQRLSMAMDLQTKVPGYAYRQLSRAEAQAQKANKALEDATRAGKVTPDIEARALVSRRVAQEAAKISVDLERNVPRTMAPQVRLRVAEKIGEQEAVIKALEAERDAARSNPDFTEDMVDVSRTRQIVSEPGDIGIVGDEAIPSVREETYTEQIPRYDYEIMQAKGKLAQLKQAYREGMTAPAVEGASFVGEAQRSFRRALFGQFPELMGGAITQWGESLESPLVQSLGEGIRSQGIADQQSLPAEANPTLDSIRAWNIGDVSRYVGSKLGQSFGYAAPIMATYMASIPAGIGVGMAMGQGEVRNALEQEFALLGIEPDPKKMATYVYMAGSAVGLIDSAAAAFHLNTLTGTAKQAAKASFLRALALGVANNAAVEGITEGVQETILALVESHATNLGIDRDEYVKRLMESVAAGAIGGAGFGAAGSLRQYAMDLERDEFERLVKGEAEKIVQDLQQEAQKAAPEAQDGAPRGGRRQAPAEGVATRPVPQETQAPPAAPPQDAASFIRERGGIVDETGDMASFGAPKSIVNNQTGLSPDAMREALVEAGYITETGGDGQAQTTVDDVYEIVRRITAGEKVYPVGTEGEVAAIEGRRPNMRDEEANAILSDLQAQMERDGIPYTLSEREEQAVIKGVRDEGLDPYDAFESAVMQSELNRVGALREGRDQGQRTSIPSEIFPSVGPRSQGGSRAPARAASGRNAGGSGRQARGGSGAGRITARHLNSFANYLKEGGSLAVRNYKEIAQEVGLEPEQVLDLMREAQAQGIVKPDRRGRMRRGPNLETFRGVDVPDIGAAQRGQSSVGRRRQEFVETLKTENGTWQADKAIVKQMLDEMKPLRGILPEDTYVGVIESAKFDGVYDVDGRYEIHAEMTFRGYGNKKHRVAMTPEQAASTGFFFYVGEDDNMYVLAFTPVTGEAATGESLAGGLYHEAVHNLHHTGSFGERFGRLAAHGESLGIFDMTVKEYLTLTKDATASLEPEGGRTIGEAYLELYTKNGIKGAKLENYLQQEAAAIFTELWQHNYWTQAELEPVLDILEDIESGRLARGEVKSLDMSQAARMARAREMGFDTPMYHVTRNNFDQFEPGARGASFFASSADDAARGAGAGQREWTMNTATEPDRRTPRTIEAIGKSSTIEGLALNPRQRAFFSELPETVSLDEYNSALRPKIEQEFGTVPAWLYDEGSVKMPDGTVYSYDDLSRLSDSELDEVMATGVETLRRGAIPEYSYEDAVRTGRDIFGRQIAHWGPGSDEASIARRVSDSGMGGYLVQDEAGVTIAVTDPRNIRSVNAAFDPAESGSPNLLASIAGSRPRQVDDLGYYSQALEAAKSLRQAKGTPEQMLAMLKKEGARQAELDAAMVPEFLKGKATVTRDEIVRHLEENGVRLERERYDIDNRLVAAENGLKRAYKRFESDPTPRNEEFVRQAQVVVQNLKDSGSNKTKWSSYSLDPYNLTYRETVLYLGEETVQRKAVMKELEGQSMTAENVAKLQATEAFRSGHFPEPNIIGHTMSSIVKHEGQTTYLVDQIQSDWGQKLRDGGVRDEAKIAELQPKVDAAYAAKEAAFAQLDRADPVKTKAYEDANAEYQRLDAELRTAEGGGPGNPLVNTTDQWVNTTLRHVIRDAALEDAKFIAIPSGSTVLSYNPGDDVGMMSFYGQQPNRTAASIMRENGESGRLVEIAEKGTEGIVPKNLRKLLQKFDKNAPPPQVVNKLETPTSGMKGEGFTVFPLTDIVKARVLNEGQALFSLAGGPNLPDSQRRIPKPGPGAAIKPLSEVMDDLIKALGLIRQHGRLNPSLKAQAGKAGGQLLGQHNANTGVTRTAIPMDMETLAHEGGHALEVRFSQTRVQNESLRLIMDRWRNELEPLATMGRDQLSEGFAEFFRRYVTNPSAAENAAPNFMNEFEDFLDAAEPGLRDALEQVQVGYQDWIDAPSGVAVASTIKSSRKPSLVRQWVDKYGLKGFREAASEDFNKVYTGVIDDLNPMNQAVSRLLDIASRNIRTTLGVRQSIGVTAANDPYKLLRLARNAYQRGHMALMRGVIPYMGTDFKGASFRDAMGTALGGFDAESWSDENRTRFDSYLTSKRMVREWDRFKAGEIARPPDKLSKADHEQNIAELEAQNPSFRQGAERLYEYQGNLLKLAYDAGFMSKDAYETYIQRNDYYVPLNRYFSEDEKLSVDGQTFAEDGSRRLMRQFRGSTRDIISPTESIAKFTYELHYIIARNDAVKALDTLARAAGPGGGQIAERIPNVQVRGMSVDAVEVVKQAGKAQGLDDQDLMFMVKAIEDGLGEDTETTLFTAGEINAAGEPIIFMWEDGKRVPLRLNDPDIGRDMYEAITGLGKEWGGFSLYLASLPTRMLRAGVTLDPAFIGANFARDQFAAWINSDDFTPFVTGVRGTAEAYRANMGQEAKDADLLNAMGGIMGGASVAELSETRVKRDIERLRTKGIRFTEGFNFITNRGRLQEVTGITESGTRIGVFRNARQRALNDGLSEYEALIEAAYSANDIIDFGRHGSKMLAVRRLVTFLNASLQGLDRSIRTGIGQTESKVAVRDLVSPYIKHRTGQPLTILERKQVSTAAKFHAKMVSIGLIGAAMSLLYMDDEEYQEIPEYIRDTHWVFKIEDGSWVRFPKPFELAIYSNIAERAIEYGVGGDEAALDRMRRGLFAVLIPPHTVPGVQTGYELWANKSAFSGAPIVNDMLLAYEPEMQFTSYTSEFSKTMAQWTGVSAAKLDHAIMGITGGLGRIALDASNQTFPAIGQGLDAAGLPTMGFSTTPRTAIRQNDIPFVKRFTTDPARSSLSRREFYQQMARTDGEMSMVANSYKERWDRGEYLEATQLLSRRSEQQRAYALLEGHGSAAEKRLHPMNRARDILSTTNSIKRELATGELKRADGTAYSPSDRRTILQMIEQVQMREARNAMVMIGLPGYAQRKILDNEPIWKELQTKAPDLWVELDYRLNKKKIQPMDVIRTEWPALRQRVLAPGYAEQNPPTRASGRRSGYDVDVTP